MNILNGENGPARDIVLLNAGASLLIAGAAVTIVDGIARAAQALDSGDARRVLDRLATISNAAPEAA
jgi:anthranilate phosphoribosyltransferase